MGALLGAFGWFLSLILFFVIPPIGIPLFILSSLIWGFGVSVDEGPSEFLSSLVAAIVTWIGLAALIYLFLCWIET